MIGSARGVSVLCSAAHHGKNAVFGAGLTPGDRRVHKAETVPDCFGIKFARDLSGGRRMIDKG